MNTIELVGTILGSNVITTTVGSVVTWLLAKKKYNTEVDSNVIQNMQDSLEFYKKLCDDNTQRLEAVLKRNEELNNQVLSLQSEILEIYKFIGVQTKEELMSLKATMSTESKKNVKSGK